MPIIKSAKKKMRKDKKRTAHNKKIEYTLKKLIKDARNSPSKDNLSKVFSAVDKASKVKIIHKNNASRIKSRLVKFLSSSK